MVPGVFELCTAELGPTSMLHGQHALRYDMERCGTNSDKSEQQDLLLSLRPALKALTENMARSSQAVEDSFEIREDKLPFISKACQELAICRTPAQCFEL